MDVRIVRAGFQARKEIDDALALARAEVVKLTEALWAAEKQAEALANARRAAERGTDAEAVRLYAAHVSEPKTVDQLERDFLASTN